MDSTRHSRKGNYRKIFYRNYKSFNQHIFDNDLEAELAALKNLALRVKCPYSEIFWSAFSRIQTEYVEILQFECEKIRTKKTPSTDTLQVA